MTVDLDTPGSAPDGSDRPGELIVPYPVPPGLLDELVEALGDVQGDLDRTVAFAEVDGLPPEIRVGWQVGVLVRLIPHGLRAVGGVDPVVVRRVREVLRLTEEAR